MLKTEVKKR